MIIVECPICKIQTETKIIYKENFDINSFNASIFSARRLPDNCHYQLVKCNRCGLTFSNPVLESEKLALLYKDSYFTYEEEIENIKSTYGSYIKKLDPYLEDKSKILEVGCGNGFILEKARELGYRAVYGVEPSIHAVQNSSDSIKSHIIVDVLKEGLFEANSFDVICFFQVLDHIPDPTIFIKTCYDYLKKGGVILCITHNIDSLQSKILKEKSPIVDIEHTCLFNKKTLRRIFEINNFNILKELNIRNTYTLRYWFNMFPLRISIKNKILKILNVLKLDKVRLSLPAGNIGIVVQK
ncbi:MAG: class I SAM-dependent methyltransferase [Bacteroidota bacterium]|nr:class I SAM-dependent methyltransferase [Bacteroidota bacterium]